MVAPITGPFYVNQNLVCPTQPTVYDFVSYKEVWKQTKPYDIPLPYQHRMCVLTKPRWGVEASGAAYDAGLAVTWATLSTTEFNDLVSRSYDKLKDAFQADRAQWLVALATMSQSAQMVALRLEQLMRFSRAVRQRRFMDAWRILGQPDGRPPRVVVNPHDPTRGTSLRSRDFGSAWLEYSYGWKPFLDDIHNGLKVLGELDLGTRTIQGKATISQEEKEGAATAWSQLKTWRGKASIRQSMQVKVTNPNLVLWNQLGLINPATVVWEKIPFSFVVDWFANVSQFLETGTDWLGVERSHEFATLFWRGSVTSEWGTPPGGGAQFDVVRLYRKQGIYSPSLAVKPLRVWHWKRGLNAASLLTQFLKSV